ncbi:SGS domain-containing protein [Coniochaeta sp. 2T2.1]|nr:SGS domain-containing protein [Coniochaeta sp. 2T2.1]
MSNEGQKGLAALKDRKYEQALAHFTKEPSTSPAFLIARSQAHQHLKHYAEALRDAELAYHVAIDRGSGNTRQQMIDAQYRRAVALFHLGRYADADCCARWSQLLCEGRPANEQDGVEKNVDEEGYYTVTLEEARGDTAGQPNTGNGIDNVSAAKTAAAKDWNRAYVWRTQVLSRMESLPKDDPARKVSVKKIPDRPVEEKKSEIATTATAPAVDAADKQILAGPTSNEPVPIEKLKAKVDFYQTNTTVTISYYAKGADKSTFKADFHKSSVTLGPLPREAAPYVEPGDEQSFSTLKLSGSIVPEKSRFTVSPRKIELVVEKAVPGTKWKAWGVEAIGRVPEDTEGTDGRNAAEPKQPAAPQTAPSPTSTAAPAQAEAPSYPTSSKSGPKNWEKVAAEAGDDDDDGKDVNYFFKQLYKGATPEQQRAMMKSFVESNGTALSTDWEDVSKRKVETVPPEGVDVRKWD